jgi:hypothetical protein
MQNTETQAAGRLELSTPRQVGVVALTVICGYGLLVCVPLVGSWVWVSIMPFGLGTFLVPLAGFVIATFFLPLGFGNSYVTSLVRSFAPAAGRNPDTFVVQLTLTPRLRSGLRAIVEDADDFGCLKVTTSALEFQGDSVNFTIPLTQFQPARQRSIGWRGLFLQHRVVLDLSGQPGFEAIEVVERSCLSLPKARAGSERLYKRLSDATAAQPGAGSK